MKKINVSIHPVGCSGIVCYVGDSISDETNDLVHVISSHIKNKMGHKITGVVPSYHSVTMFYDSITYSFFELKKEVETQILNLQTINLKQKKTIYEIPVCYGLQYGPDIENVMNLHHISINELIQMHQESLYRIYMIGFLPGFPYLGGLNSKLATPRLKKPKLVRQGAVGIAGEQTGIYPFESPGGWNIIGQTPVNIFSNNGDDTVLFQPGSFLRFKSINEFEFAEIEKSIKEGSFSLKKEVLEVDEN